MTTTCFHRLRSLGLALCLGFALQPAQADQAADVDALITALAPMEGQQEAAPPQPESAEVNGRKVYLVPAFSADVEVYFAYDSSELTARGRSDLAALGHALASARLRPYKYLIAGHTDASGAADYNQALSERRALSVVRFLVESFPIQPQRLLAVGWGETRLKTPDAPNAAVNRRVEVVFMIPAGEYVPGSPYYRESAPAPGPEPQAEAPAPEAATPAPDAPKPGTLQTDEDGNITITW